MDLPHNPTTANESASSRKQDHAIQKAFSCMLCAQRKVKCDKQSGGCANCTKARVSCVYKAPLPPRRKKRGLVNVDVAAKLRIYEEALRKAGIDPEDLIRQETNQCTSNRRITIGDISRNETSETTNGTSSTAEIGVLITEEGKSRYLENGIWTRLRSEFRDLKDILDETSDEESGDETNTTTPEPFSADGSRLLFGSPASSTGLSSLHPQPVQIFKLWQKYLDNINPLVKVFHVPTVQHVITDASGNVDKIPRNVEALLFAIYCIAVETLSEGECTGIMFEPKSVVVQRFRSGAQNALINASFLKTSDLMVLQALTLFILSLQNIDARVVWILSGLAQRVAQRIGLHHDGEKLKLPPFETEIRRRLWWQIIILEGFSQKVAGTGTGTTVLMGNVKMPSNLNDSDLFPGMKELPQESDRATDMMFFLIRCHVGDFMKRFEAPQASLDGAWSKLTTRKIDVAVKLRAIEDLEARFEEKFLRHCDSSIAWHFMCTHLAKAVIFMMRFMVYGAEYQGKTETQAQKDALFNLALQVCSSQNLAYSMREMQGFVWHVNAQFQWKAFVYVVSELRYRTEGELVERAWKEVELTFSFHPSFDDELSVKALPIAISNLTIKAWDAYKTARGAPGSSEPYFIQMLRNRQHRTKKRGTHSKPANNVTPPQQTTDIPSTSEYSSYTVKPGYDLVEGFNWNPADLNASLGVPTMMPDLESFNYTEGMNWSSWNDLLVDYRTDSASGFAGDIDLNNFSLQ